METDSSHMPYDPSAIANSLLDIAKSRGHELDPMKLQKLIYYSHGWALAIANKPLINEPVEAWRFGPVIPSVYHEFKRFGSNPITEYSKVLEGPKLVEPRIRPDDEFVESLLGQIWEVYGGFTGIQLSNMSHEPGSPWETAWGRNVERLRFVVIPNEEIKKHFLCLIG